VDDLTSIELLQSTFEQFSQEAIALESSQLKVTRQLGRVELEEEFQERVRQVIHKLYSAAQNSTSMRDGAPSFEEVAIFLLEIIGTVVGLSWGAYSTLIAAVSAPPQ
jgi:hypothetical protein